MNYKLPERSAEFSEIGKPANWLPFVAMLVIFILYFYPILFEDYTLIYEDIINFAFPMKWHIWKTWKLGEWPFWFPNIFHGAPFLSLMHPGVFYPPSAIFLLNDFILAFNIYFLFHHLVLMFSVYALSRYWQVSKLASVFSAATVLLGGFFLSLSPMYNHFHSLVWFPLILLFHQKYIVNKRTAHLLITSILVAFQVLAGGPENVILSVLISYTSSIFLIPGVGLVDKTLKMIAVVILSLGISALQWIPTFHLMEHLIRAEGLDFAYSTRWSLEPRSLADIILPENSQPFFDVEESGQDSFLKSIYMGLIPILILLTGVIRFRKDTFAKFWIVTFFVGIFLSLGKNNPAFFYIYSWVPLFDLFRFPPKFFFLSAFALAFLSGRGLDHLARDLSERKMEWVVPLSFLLILAAFSILIFFYFDNPRIVEALMILGLAALACLAVYFGKIDRKVFIALLLLLSVLDLMGKNGLLLPFIDKTFYTQTPVLAKQIGNGADAFRVFKDERIRISRFVKDLRNSSASSNQLSPLDRSLFFHDELFHNLGTIYGVAYANGRAGVLRADSALWRGIFNASDRDRKKRILMRSNVKYQVGFDYEVPPSPVLPRGVKKLEEFRDTLPRAFLVGRSLRKEGAQILNTYYSESFDPLQEVLLDEEVPIQTRDDFSGQVKKITYSPNKVQLLTEQNGEGFLVLLDSYFPGWKVEVDGKPEHIYRANYFYRGVKLGAGDHSIEFSYIPEGLETGLRISFLTIFFILVGCAYKQFRKFRWSV